MDKTLPVSCQPLTPMARYVEGSAPREPFVERESAVIYQHPHLRFRIALEKTSDIGYGLWRSDEMQNQGLAPADLDSTEFAQNLVRTLADHLSIHNLRDLVGAFQAELDKEEARRQHYSEQWPCAGASDLPTPFNSF